MFNVFTCLLLVVVVAVTEGAISRDPSATYTVGAGIGDITGPAADVNLMGYANPLQRAEGIHLRVFARAFIFAESLESKNRIVYVSGDFGMCSHLVKVDVVAKLEAAFPGLYSAANVIISGTHTHSATAGFFQYFIFEVTSLGFIKDSHDQFVNGIFDSISKAHHGLKKGKIYLNSGELLNTQANRSPTAYLQNPPDERAKYRSDCDHNMHLLRIDDEQGNPMATVNWYPVHGTSMNNTNRLISGDNKGYAAQMFEREMEPESLAGSNKFVAAFGQAFEGDVSPNTAGAKCIDTGLPCDLETSTCDGKPTQCIAFGPGKDMFESTKIIGTHQFQFAKKLFDEAGKTGLKGGVKFVHQYVNMSDYSFTDKKTGKQAKTCIPALGYSFAAGTTDGPGLFAFSQGTESGNPFWDGVRDILKEPTQEMIDCHYPKPILLSTGLMDRPYAWHPKIIDCQMAQVGQLVIVAVPGEFTTMSGRRMIAAITKVFADHGEKVQVVISGLSNVYTHYITTPEEYSRQRYEGGSTIFGPNSLPAYIDIYEKLALALIKGEQVPEGPAPENLKDQQWTLLPEVIFDGSGDHKFGDVASPPSPAYRPGDIAECSFVGASPRNSMGTDLKAFLTVEKLEATREESAQLLAAAIFNLPEPKLAKADQWNVVMTDAEWETKFHWKRDSTILGTSNVKMEWEIPSTQKEGTYRLCYHGHSKSLRGGKIAFFENCSPSFAVSAPKMA